MIERVRRVSELDDVVIATSENEENDVRALPHPMPAYRFSAVRKTTFSSDLMGPRPIKKQTLIVRLSRIVRSLIRR